MPKLEADFSKISSNTDKLAEDTYRFRVVSAQDGEEKAGKQTPFIVVSEVQSGERAGAQIQDYIYLKTKDGKPNKIGLGRVKAYAEAILGAETASSPKGIDTDDFVGGEFDGIIKHESYTDESVQPPVSKTAARLNKILPAS
jgi:hypothetical protein